MWFTFVTARLFHSLSFQPRLAATLLSSCSVANSLIRRAGLSPTFRSASLAQHPCSSVVEILGPSSSFASNGLHLADHRREVLRA